MRDLESAIKNLSPKDKAEIFRNGKNFISLEVLYPGTANVIPYGAAQLRLHHIKMYDKNGNVEGETQEPVKRLQAALEQQKTQNQKTYQIRATDPATIKPDQDYKAKKIEFTSELAKIRTKYKLNKDDKISLYFYNWWKDFIYFFEKANRHPGHPWTSAAESNNNKAEHGHQSTSPLDPRIMASNSSYN